ncbi:MAG: hypothetical protein GEV08_17140 [Acidimicrobiia bacterium]|nr:hypothetical protein [Acidimicrobiia bacterium]
MAVAGGAEVEDLGEEFRRGDAPADAGRHGVKLVIHVGCLDEVARRIATLIEHDSMGPGDIGVLVPTNRMVNQVVARLKADGLDVQELDRYDGRPTQRVKVGTYHRGKGLEFKAVFLPGLSKGVYPRPPRDTDSVDEAAEANDLALSQLFVAMTRARDLLVLLYDGDISEALAGGLDRFEREST